MKSLSQGIKTFFFPSYMMKLLAVLEVQAGKTMVKEPHSGIT